jgi:hypothetical protein
MSLQSHELKTLGESCQKYKFFHFTPRVFEKISGGSLMRCESKCESSESKKDLITNSNSGFFEYSRTTRILGFYMIYLNYFLIRSWYSLYPSSPR